MLTHVVISCILCIDVVVVVPVCGARGVFVGNRHVVATFQITRGVVTKVLSLQKQMDLVKGRSLAVVTLPTFVHLEYKQILVRVCKNVHKEKIILLTRSLTSLGH